jgi:hypothetical protein
MNSKRMKCAVLAIAVFMALAQTAPIWAQNLGAAPAFNAAVQGEQATQVEGGFLNIVNWFGNVIAPVGAALAIGIAIVHALNGRGYARWGFGGVGLLAVSAITRLSEAWITNGAGGVT